jgi:hypothetical protein
MTHVFLDAKLKDAAKMSFGFATVPFCIVVDKVSEIGETPVLPRFHLTHFPSLSFPLMHCTAERLYSSQRTAHEYGLQGIVAERSRESSSNSR